MKFLFEFKSVWERKGALELIRIQKVKFIMSMLPPGGGRNSVDPRFLSHVNCAVIHDPTEETRISIY